MRLTFSRRLPAAALAVVGLAAALVGAPAAGPPPLASEEKGSGSPTIVLIHSIGGDRSDWSAVATLLAVRHRVLLIDLPGHGESALPTKAPAVKDVAREVARALFEHRVERAILVGHSYGALIALQTALDQPKRAQTVVAVDTPTYSTADSEQVASVDKILRERYTVFLSAVFTPMSRDQARGDTLVAHAARVPHDVLAGYFRDAWKEDLRPRLRKLKTPVHLVATETLWPPGESWTSARRRLGYETAGPAQGHRILDSGHMVAMDQPDSLAAVIEAIAAAR